MEEAQIFILGSAADDALGEELIAALRPHLPKAEFNNRCGKLPLPDSLALLRSMDEFWGIDSGILHAARLLGISSHSVWGPTDPRTRLRPIHGLQETILYERIACSPCIHVTEAPPCEGNNICIRRMFEHNLVVDLEKSAFTVWPKPPNNSL